MLMLIALGTKKYRPHVRVVIAAAKWNLISANVYYIVRVAGLLEKSFLLLVCF